LFIYMSRKVQCSEICLDILFHRKTRGMKVYHQMKYWRRILFLLQDQKRKGWIRITKVRWKMLLIHFPPTNISLKPIPFQSLLFYRLFIRNLLYFLKSNVW
jgi:hypothetical protein